jgi:hypothetical protein
VLHLLAQLGQEPRRLVTVVLGRRDGGDQQPLPSPRAGDVEQPPLLGQQRPGGQRRHRADVCTVRRGQLVGVEQ